MENLNELKELAAEAVNNEVPMVHGEEYPDIASIKRVELFHYTKDKKLYTGATVFVRLADAGGRLQTIRFNRKDENLELFSMLRAGNYIAVIAKKLIANVTTYRDNDEVKFHKVTHLKWNNVWTESTEEEYNSIRDTRE